MDRLVRDSTAFEWFWNRATPQRPYGSKVATPAVKCKQKTKRIRRQICFLVVLDRDRLDLSRSSSSSSIFSADCSAPLTPQDPQANVGPAGRNGHEPTPIEPGPQTVTVLSKPIRDRDRAHLKYVAGQPCLICSRTPSDPHHVKFAESWTVGRKVSDRFTVPLCRLHHHELHRRGDERVWRHQQGIEPLQVAKNLWSKTHAPGPDEIAHVSDSNRGTLVGGADLAN